MDNGFDRAQRKYDAQEPPEPKEKECPLCCGDKVVNISQCCGAEMNGRYCVECNEQSDPSACDECNGLGYIVPEERDYEEDDE